MTRYIVPGCIFSLPSTNKWETWSEIQFNFFLYPSMEGKTISNLIPIINIWCCCCQNCMKSLNTLLSRFRFPGIFISWEWSCKIKCYSIYEAFHISSPGAARELEIMLFSACVWRAKMYLKKIIPKWFRCTLSSAFRWCY